MVRPYNGGGALVLREPARQYAIALRDGQRAADRAADCAAVFPDANHGRFQLCDVIAPPYRRQRKTAIRYNTKSNARHAIEQCNCIAQAYSRLRKNRAVGRMDIACDEAAGERRQQMLARCCRHLASGLGEEPCIARARRLRIALTDQAPNILDQRGVAAHMPGAFGGVSVEQTFAGLALQHEMQFPREIRHIAQALAHALAREWRLLVGGIACDEHACLPPAVRHQRVKAIGRRAPQRCLARADPAREQSPDLRIRFHLPRVLAGQ